MFKHKYESENKKRGPKGWEDEEENNYKINNNKINNNRFTSMNNNSISQNHYEEYRSEQKDRKIMNNINIELKIIDDIIQPTGISLKPTDNHLKEFARRIKNFDKEIIFNIFLQKLSNYENFTDITSIKSITKLLYVVEYIMQIKLDEFFQAFSEKKEIFENLRDHFLSVNKKTSDIANSILMIINPIEKKENIYIPNKQNNNLFDFNDNNKLNLLGENVSNNFIEINKEDKKSTFKFIKKDINTISNNNSEIKNNQILDIFANSDINFSNDQNKDNQSFSFIKSKSSVEPIKNELIDVFQVSNVKNSESKLIDITRTDNSDINDIFNKRSNINLNLITMNLQHNYINEQNDKKHNIDLENINKFNYNHVYGNIETEKKNKDPFSFVDELLKKK